MKRILTAGLIWICALAAAADVRLSDPDRSLLATCMVLEAGGEGREGMRAVLNVIVNRAGGDADRLVPVTLQHGAFSCMSDAWRTESPDLAPLIGKAESQGEPYAAALELIDELEQGTLKDNTQGATHYHADYIHPYWASSLEYLTTIGSHLFYVERGRQFASL